MKKSRSIGLWSLAGCGITSLGGTILHFLYDWLGEAKWIAPFSGINESTWEHMKLLFWPMFIFSIIQSFFFRENKSYWCIKMKSVLLGLIAIPVLFYTYNGAIGKSPDWLNITIFFISAAIAYILEVRQFKKDTTVCRRPYLAFAILLIIAICFVTLTFFTPEIGIFKDPITGAYGIQKAD